MDFEDNYPTIIADIISNTDNDDANGILDEFYNHFVHIVDDKIHIRLLLVNLL
jgi:hypothetical protein